MRSSNRHLAEVRRRATDAARAEATLRADAGWQDTYRETFAQVYDQTMTELLAEQRNASGSVAPAA
jgi:hypothetical protein